MLSLGKAHRLGLQSRLHRLEQQGVTWTQEDVDRCLTMERFLDYLENRESMNLLKLLVQPQRQQVLHLLVILQQWDQMENRAPLPG